MAAWTITIGAATTMTLNRVYQELSGHEEARVSIPNTAANRAQLTSDQDTTIQYNGNIVFSGLCTGGEYDNNIEAFIYDKVYQTLANQEPYSATYNTLTAANTILGNILAGTGINVGECPTTTIAVRYDRANRLMSAIYIADALNLEYWTSGGDTFNIGTRGSCYLQLKLDEGAGTASAFDTSGKENNFSFPGGGADPTWIPAAKFGAGLSFDGGDYLSKASKVISTLQDFTFTCYVKPDGVVGDQYIARRSSAWSLRLKDDEIRFTVDTDALPVTYETNNANLLIDTWYRITVVYTHSTLTAKIYKDKVECTYFLAQAGTGTEDDTANIVFIGSSSAIGGFITGDLDEIQLFQRTLNQAEIDALNGVTLYSRPKRGIDRSKDKNYCVVVATDEDGNVAYGEAYVDATTGALTLGTPGGGFTYRGFRKTTKTIMDQTSLNRLAATYLKDARLETSSITCEVTINAGWALNPGDYVVVEDARLVLGDVYRVQARTVRLAIVQLEIDRIQGKADKDILSLFQYEEFGIYSINPDQLDNPVGPPTAPAVPTALAEIDSIRVTWAANTEPDMDRYRLYRSNATPVTTGDTLVSTTDTTVYVDDNVAYASSYYYALTAVDRAGNVSTIGGSSTPNVSPNRVDGTTDVTLDSIEDSRLKAGIQPYETIVEFEKIKADFAALGLTAAIVVDSGGGKGRITASAGTPFADFSAGDKVTVAYCENDGNLGNYIIDAVNNTIMTLTAVLVTANADDAYLYIFASDAIKWTGNTPAIYFSDGGTNNIDSGSDHGLTETLHYWYFTVGNAVLTETTVYTNTIGNTVGVLCKAEILVGREPDIRTFRSKGQNLVLDSLAVGDLDAKYLTAEWIVGKKFRTWGRELGTGGIDWDDSGIRGYSDAVTKTFDLESATGYINVYGLGSFNVRQTVANGGAIRGYLEYAEGDSAVRIRTTSGINFWIEVDGDTVKFIPGGNIVVSNNFGAIIPSIDGGVDLGSQAVKFGDVWGDAHYADFYIADLYCPRCDEKFKPKDEIRFTVTGYRDYDDTDFQEIIAVPIHSRCSIISLIKKKLGWSSWSR